MGEVKHKIHEFEKQFNALKKTTREGLESRKIDVKSVVECLTELSVDDMQEHKMFLDEKMDDLLQAESLFKLFLRLNLYWHYLAYHLLEHLIKKFSVEEVKGKMEKYKTDLWQFMWDTPLKLFCQAHKKRAIDLPPWFRELVIQFAWPENVTLRVVEEFRQQYASHYGLRECAMMVVTMVTSSFTDVRHIPEPYLNRKMVEDAPSKYKQVTNYTLHISSARRYSPCIFW